MDVLKGRGGMEKALRMIERRCASCSFRNQSFSCLFLGFVLRFYMAFSETLVQAC